MANGEWRYRLAGVFSGLLLLVGNIYPAMALLRVGAFLPVLYLAAGENKTSRYMLIAGLYMGLLYTLPQMIILRLPALMTLIILSQMLFVMCAFAWGSAMLLRGTPPVLGAIAAGALLAVLNWLNFTVIPIWGTAQSLARPWSYYPVLISFVSYTGITGINFFLVAIQALAVNFFTRPKARRRIILAAASILLIFAFADLAVMFPKPTGKLKVAAIGWKSEDAGEAGMIFSEKHFNKLFAEPTALAAKQGARLIVLPELCFWFAESDRQEWLDKIVKVARENNIFLVVGYFDEPANENKLLFMNPQGEVLLEYTKTYLTVFESFRKGSGELKTIEVDGIKVGGMICQDDNFTALSRRYGREKCGIVAVPTLDWRQVKDAHFQNSINRAIESRYAIVRAALNGVSAIISPHGEILALKDHFTQGSGFIAAEVPVYSQRTLFSLAGHWPVILFWIFLVVFIIEFKAKIKN